MSKRVFFFSAIGLFCLCLLFSLFFFWRKPAAPESDGTDGSLPHTSSPTPTASTRETELLSQSNEAFARAKALAEEGRFAEAEQAYGQALEQDTTAVQRGIILYRQAKMISDQGRYPDAAERFKSIAQDPTILLEIRAYAIQSLRTLYLLHLSLEGNERIGEITFEGAFARFLDDKNYDLGYRRLAEYAGVLFPLALNELRIAEWHTDHMLLLQKNPQPNEQQTLTERAQDWDIIHYRMERAERDIARLESRPDVHYLLILPYLRKALILEKLDRVGDASLGDPTLFFEKALEKLAAESSANEITYPYALFEYAAYLALLSPNSSEHDEKIKTLVRRFFEEQYRDPTINAHLSRERAINRSYKERIVALGQKNADFQKYLKTLGWTEGWKEIDSQ